MSDPDAFAVWVRGEAAARLLFSSRLAAESAIDRWAEAYKNADVVPLYTADAIREAVEAEREACAKLAENTVCDVHLPTGIRIYGYVAARAIRARGAA